MKRLLIVVVLLMVLFVQGCAVIGTAVSAAAAYGLAQAFD